MKIIKKHSTLLFFSTILWLFTSLAFASSSYNLQTHILSMPVVSIDGINYDVKLDFDGDKKFTLIDSKPSTQSSDQPVVFNSVTGVATIPYVVVAETGQAYTATLTLISSNPIVTLELTSLKKIDEDSTIVIQEIYNLNLKNNDICRKGDQIKVTGLNLDKLESPDLMLASISIARIAKYIKKEEKSLYFECQNTQHYGDIDIFLKSDTVTSRATVITSLAVSTPVITDVSYNSTTDKITVTGINLNKQLTINLGDVNVKLDQQNGDPNTFTFTAYALIKSGELKIIVDGAHSNSIWVKINKTIKGKIKFVSNGVDSTHLVVGVNEDDNHPSVSGDFHMDGYRGNPTFIPVFIHSPDQNERPEYILHLAAIALPEDDFIEVSPLSTAIALLWTGANVELYISPNDQALFREQIATAPETTLFANLLAQKLATDPYVMQEEFKAGSLDDANFAVLTFTYRLIEQYQIDKGKKRDLFSKKARVFTEKFNDIQVYESDNDDGNITIKNDTQLYLAVEIRDTEDNILQELPKSVLSPLIAKPQSFTIASETPFKQPQGKHSIVDILTPGKYYQQTPHSLPDNGLVDFLLFRTIVEGVAFPIFKPWVGVSPHKVSKIILNSNIASDLVSEISTTYTRGNINDVKNLIANAIKKEFLSPGGPTPLAKELMKSTAEKKAIKIGLLILKMFPRTRPVAQTIEGVIHANDVIKPLVAIDDLISIDKQIEFNVQFTPTIEYVLPNQLQEHELKGDISILGSGYGAVIDEGNGEKVYPEIYFRDQEGTIKIVEVKKENTQKDGRKVVVQLPAEFQNPLTKFPLDIAIRHPTTNPNPDFPLVENAIDLVASNFQITGIDRDVDNLTDYLNWTGFSPSVNTNSIMFLNRKLIVCEIPVSPSDLGRACFDSAQTSYDITGNSIRSEQYIQAEGSIVDVFKTYPVTDHASHDIRMPHTCSKHYILLENDPNKKYRVEWEIFLEKREFNVDSGLYEPVDQTQTINFAYDCIYSSRPPETDTEKLRILSVTPPFRGFVYYYGTVTIGDRPEMKYEGKASSEFTLEAKWVDKAPIEAYSTTEFKPLQILTTGYSGGVQVEEDAGAYYCPIPISRNLPPTIEYTVIFRLKDEAGNVSDTFPFSYTCEYINS